MDKKGSIKAFSMKCCTQHYFVTTWHNKRKVNKRPTQVSAKFKIVYCNLIDENWGLPKENRTPNLVLNLWYTLKIFSMNEYRMKNMVKLSNSKKNQWTFDWLKVVLSHNTSNLEKKFCSITCVLREAFNQPGQWGTTVTAILLVFASRSPFISLILNRAVQIMFMLMVSFIAKPLVCVRVRAWVCVFGSARQCTCMSMCVRPSSVSLKLCSIITGSFPISSPLSLTPQSSSSSPHSYLHISC